MPSVSFFFRKNFSVLSGFLLLLLLVVSTGCATYYQKNLKFQEAFSAGRLEKAEKLLNSNEKDAESRNRLLYFMKRGVVSQMMGQYEQSNVYFEQAYTFLEDYKSNYGIEALSLISNPTLKPYTGEDHEKVLIHYYKALNYLMMDQPAEALVECRRLNNKLNLLNDRYEDRKNRYKDDAFAHVLMGIAYERSNDVNNAFIAYRNANESYKANYASDYGVQAPEQLKKDLLRTAYLNGFQQELREYEKEFGMTYHRQKEGDGELIFFWENGLGPVKDEWSVNFTIVKGAGGVVTFVNDELGLNFSFPLPQDDNGSGGLGDLKFIRVAFPKYLERPPYFTSASISVNGKVYPLEEAEDINAIAISVLQDRMLREMGSSLLRLALKQASEYAVRQENQDLGAVVSVVNALTEKADTRNWQTLPYSISYARIPLQEGDNAVELKTNGPDDAASNTETFNYHIEKGQTVFQIFHSLESRPLQAAGMQ